LRPPAASGTAASARSTASLWRARPGEAESRDLALGLGTAFTYQGRLTDAEGPVEGTCDLTFRLYDAAGSGSPPTGGTLLGTVNKTSQTISDGYFTVQLDFGGGTFTGDARWLQIAVDCGDGAVTLAPRQELTPAPYALYAPSAGTVPWIGLSGVPGDLIDGDDDTTYGAGSGLELSGTEFSVDTGAIQQRVGDTCPAGSSIRVIHVDGTVDCETDDVGSGGGGGDITAVIAGHGLTGGGESGTVTLDIDQSYRLPQSCTNGEIPEWSGTTWACGTDDVGTGGGGGDITGVNAGGGLTGGGSSGDVTLEADFAGSGSADTVARSDHDHDSRYYTQSQLSGGTATVHWDALANVPSGLSDGDQDSLADLAPCGGGQVPQWDDELSQWVCGDDGDTTYSAGNQLQLSGTTFGVLEGTGSGLDADLLDGQHGSFYRDASNLSAGTVPAGRYSSYDDLISEGRLDNDAGGDLLTRDQADDRYWSLGGNSGTSPGTDFLGTSDNRALELRVDGARALRIEPDATSPNLIGGYSGNQVMAGVYGATIGGGGFSSETNRVTDHFGTVGGGEQNLAGDDAGTASDAWGATVGGGNGNQATGVHATVGGGIGNLAWGPEASVGGGRENVATHTWSTVGGGYRNEASGEEATVGGGKQNSATGTQSTVGGGADNTAGYRATVGGGLSNSADGSYSVVPGGHLNSAAGSFSFAAGRRARANHDGSFIWADSTDADFASTEDNQFGARATGGFKLSVDSNDGGMRVSPVDYWLYGTAVNVIAGDGGNHASLDVIGATISGGGQEGETNRVTGIFGAVGGGRDNTAGHLATVGGGEGNTASGQDATVGGGGGNTASGQDATVGGGYGNTASSYYATVGGGLSNSAGYNAIVAGGINNAASGTGSTVGGGSQNAASGDFSAVPGGNSNSASGSYSFAAGRRAKANYQGCFVWSDSTNEDFACSFNDQMRIRANGGATFIVDSGDYEWVRFKVSGGHLIDTSIGAHLTIGGTWTNGSSRALKENLAPVAGTEVLARLAEVPIHTWNYRAEDPSIRRMGPVAEDFYAAFGLGEGEEHIATVDADGVALAAIQGLHELSQERAAQVQAMEKENATLRREVNDLEARVAALELALTSDQGAAPSDLSRVARVPPVASNLLPGVGILVTAVVVAGGARRQGGLR
jgi:hypothetical protein